MTRRLVVTALALAAMGAGAQDLDVTWRWHGAIAPGKGIEIKGVNGSIRAERASGSEVEVVATKTVVAAARPTSVRRPTVVT